MYCTYWNLLQTHLFRTTIIFTATVNLQSHDFSVTANISEYLKHERSLSHSSIKIGMNHYFSLCSPCLWKVVPCRQDILGLADWRQQIETLLSEGNCNIKLSHSFLHRRQSTWGCCWYNSDRNDVHTLSVVVDTEPNDKPRSNIWLLEFLQSDLWILHEEAGNLQHIQAQTHTQGEWKSQQKTHTVTNSQSLYWTVTKPNVLLVTTLWSTRVTHRPGVGRAEVRCGDYWRSQRERRSQGGRRLLEGNLHLPPISTPPCWHDLRKTSQLELQECSRWWRNKDNMI